MQFPVDDCRCGCRSISKCGRTNGQGRSVHLVDDFPRHAANAALSRVSDLVVGVGREVEIAVGTCLAPVGQLNVDDLAPDWNGQQGSAGPERERGVLRTGNFGSLAAHGVLIGVAARVTTVRQNVTKNSWEVRSPEDSRERIEERVRHGGNVVSVVVGDTTSTKTGGIEGC